jgi:hypothetical protein
MYGGQQLEKSAAEEYPGLMGRKPFSFVQKKNKTT